MAEILPDFPPGPLDAYRRKTSFDWRKLKIFLESEFVIKYKQELYDIIRKHPVLYDKELETLSLDQQRQLANKKLFTLKSLDFTSVHTVIKDPRKYLPLMTVLSQVDSAAGGKYLVNFILFLLNVIVGGTERHQHYVQAALKDEIISCFCLTEIGHGSNTKGMRTTATYDKDTKEFVLNSPDFQAAKAWVGGLAQSASYAILYAQLITPDRVNHGLHSFVVKIRDPNTLRPYPGVTIGDLGEKIALNGIDNGFIMFDHYRIPRADLLNKNGDVTEDGVYVTPHKDPNKRHGASLGSLSGVRIDIANFCANHLVKALTIAIRYSAVRKQFGPDGTNEEVSILEYQTHQYRLLPHLSLAYALVIFCPQLKEVHQKFTIDLMTQGSNNFLADMGLELHAISAACKCVASWYTRDAAQECREACGGHGFLKAAQLGEVRNENDPNCTYEGENHVLIQQTSNWLLKFWPKILKGEKLSTPLGSIDFLSDLDSLNSAHFSATTVEQVMDPINIFNAYQWLVMYLLKVTYDKYNTEISLGTEPFWAKNNCQVFYAKNLAVAYIEHYILQQFYSKISEANDTQIQNGLSKLFSLFGLWSLQKHMMTLYQGGYANGPRPGTLIQDAILKLCSDIKDDAVSLIDVVAPPDFLLNSILGYSDGKVYQHLQNAVFSAPGSMSRPTWWKEIAQWKDLYISKL